MPSLFENIWYEVQMIGGGLIVICAGLLIWGNFVRKSGFKESCKTDKEKPAV